MYAAQAQVQAQAPGGGRQQEEDFNLLQGDNFPSAFPGLGPAAANSGRWAGTLGGGANGALRPEDFPSLPGEF